MRIILVLFCTVTVFYLFSCGGNNKQTQSNISNSIDEEKQFALSLYGDEVKVLVKGDLLANKKQSAVVGIVRKQATDSWWVQKASFIQKENDKWRVLLKIEQKIASVNGELVSQVDANNGYLINIDTTKKPVLINIVMANEYGKGASDDAVIKWSTSKNDFEFVAPYEDIPQ